jgi:hypothetical protein
VMECVCIASRKDARVLMDAASFRAIFILDTHLFWIRPSQCKLAMLSLPDHFQTSLTRTVFCKIT